MQLSEIKPGTYYDIPNVSPGPVYLLTILETGHMLVAMPQFHVVRDNGTLGSYMARRRDRMMVTTRVAWGLATARPVDIKQTWYDKMTVKKPRWKLSLDNASCVMESKSMTLDVIADLMTGEEDSYWPSDGEGSPYTLQMVWMTDVEMDNLPEFEGW